MELYEMMSRGGVSGNENETTQQHLFALAPSGDM